MKTLIRAAALALVSAGVAGAQTVYNNDGSSVAGFGANTKNWTTPTTCTSVNFCGSYIGANDFAAGYIGGGVGHTFANTDVAELMLSGLGAHTGGTLFFTVFAIDSWDGNGTGCCGPDIFQVSINGVQLMNATFTDHNFDPTDVQSYPDPYGSGTHAPGTGAAENGTLGTWYWTSSPDNSVYQIAIPFLDATSALTIDFGADSDNQGFTDESWALQHVQVDLDGRVVGTPEPASMTLLATGLAGLGVAVRRRKRNA